MLHFLKRQGSASSPHISFAIFLDRGPDILMTEIPPLPEADAGAIMVLLSINRNLDDFSRIPPLL